MLWCSYVEPILANLSRHGESPELSTWLYLVLLVFLVLHFTSIHTIYLVVVGVCWEYVETMIEELEGDGKLTMFLKASKMK